MACNTCSRNAFHIRNTAITHWKHSENHDARNGSLHPITITTIYAPRNCEIAVSEPEPLPPPVYTVADEDLFGGLTTEQREVIERSITYAEYPTGHLFMHQKMMANGSMCCGAGGCGSISRWKGGRSPCLSLSQSRSLARWPSPTTGCTIALPKP